MQKNFRFITACIIRPIIDTYKTAKIPSVTSRAVELCIIFTALDVTEGFFFCFICVNYGPYTLL